MTLGFLTFSVVWRHFGDWQMHEWSSNGQAAFDATHSGMANLAARISCVVASHHWQCIIEKEQSPWGQHLLNQLMTLPNAGALRALSRTVAAMVRWLFLFTEYDVTDASMADSGNRMKSGVRGTSVKLPDTKKRGAGLRPTPRMLLHEMERPITSC